MTTAHQTTERLLSLTEAAKIAGKSYAWAWNCAADGRLQAIRDGDHQMIQVTASSLVEALLAEHDGAGMSRSDRRPRRKVQTLRLIVDNTK